MGIQGVGIATSVSNMFILVGMLIYTKALSELKEASQWPNKRTFSDIGEYLKLGIPSALMLCMEWWSFYIMILIAGKIGDKDDHAPQAA